MRNHSKSMSSSTSSGIFSVKNHLPALDKGVKMKQPKPLKHSPSVGIHWSREGRADLTNAFLEAQKRLVDLTPAELGHVDYKDTLAYLLSVWLEREIPNRPELRPLLEALASGSGVMRERQKRLDELKLLRDHHLLTTYEL